jgi:hypothetical protein
VSKADVERAHTVFLSGKQYLEESNYEKAISYFNDAYSIDCSVHGILPIIATALERKGDRAEAIRALEEYQRRAPNAPDHEVIERRLRNLNDQLADQLAREQASAAPPPPPAAPPASSAPPPSAPPVSTAALPPVPPPTAPPGPPEPQATGPSAAPWVLVGIGGAVFIAGGVMWLVGNGEVTSATSRCPNHMNCDDPSSISKGNEGRTLEYVGGPLFIGGVVASAAGLIWWAFQGPKRSPPRAAIAPSIAPGYAGVGVSGSF